MSSLRPHALGLTDAEMARLGPDGTARVMVFRIILALAQRMRTLMDQRLKADGLTTQQAALITVVKSLGAPKLSQVARQLGTTHQNTRQIAEALERKGFLRVLVDSDDRRARRLEVTHRSEAYWRGRSDADQDHVTTWFADLPPDQVADLLATLRRLWDSLSPPEQ
jgi:DNA-binding MarR family transcriptional regulator